MIHSFPAIVLLQNTQKIFGNLRPLQLNYNAKKIADSITREQKICPGLEYHYQALLLAVN